MTSAIIEFCNRLCALCGADAGFVASGLLWAQPCCARRASTLVVAVLGDQVGSRYLLGTAMAGIGLSMNFAVFRGAGLKPFAVGLAGALVVGATGLLMALWLGRFVHL